VVKNKSDRSDGESGKERSSELDLDFGLPRGFLEAEGDKKAEAIY